MKALRLCAAAAVLVSGLVFVSCNETAIPTGPSVTDNVYDNPSLGFKATIPAAFQKLTMDTVLNGQTCILYGKDSTSGVPNFNIITMANNGMDAQTMLIGTSTMIGLDNFAIVDDPDTITIDGNTCAKMTYTWTTEQTVQGATIDVPMKNKMIFMVHNGVNLILTFVDAQQGYQYHEDVFEDMIEAIDFY